MPRVQTSTGFIHFTPIAIYEGIKLIDKEKAWENLVLFKNVIEPYSIPFQLTYGTLLGACREHDFIDHDEDIDLALLEEDRMRLFDVLPELIFNGFEIARWDRKGCMSIIRNGEYIDLYFFRKITNTVRGCSGLLLPSVFLEETSEILFKGERFLCSRSFEDFLEYEYGKNWRTPVVYQNFNKNWCQRKKAILFSLIKEYLPDFIYIPLSRAKEKSLQKKHEQKIKCYLHERC